MEKNMTKSLSQELAYSKLENRKNIKHQIANAVSNISVNQNTLLEIEKESIITGLFTIYTNLDSANFELAKNFIKMINELNYYPIQSYPIMLEKALNNFFSNPKIKSKLKTSKKLIILPGGYTDEDVKSFHLVSYMFKSNLFNYILQQNNYSDLSVTIVPNLVHIKDKLSYNYAKDACFLLVDDYSATGESMVDAINKWTEEIPKCLETDIDIHLNILSLVIEDMAYNKLSKSHNVFFYKKSDETRLSRFNYFNQSTTTNKYQINSMNIMMRTSNNTYGLISDMPPFQRYMRKRNKLEKEQQKWNEKWKNY